MSGKVVGKYAEGSTVVHATTQWEAEYERDDGSVFGQKAVVVFVRDAEGRLWSHSYVWDDEERRFRAATTYTNFKRLR